MEEIGNDFRKDGLRQLVEANARALPRIEGKLRRLLAAFGGADASVPQARAAGQHGGKSSPANKEEDLLEVLENRIANQQAEWKAVNEDMEARIQDLHRRERELEGGGWTGKKIFSLLREASPLIAALLFYYWVEVRIRRRR